MDGDHRTDTHTTLQGVFPKGVLLQAVERGSSEYSISSALTIYPPVHWVAVLSVGFVALCYREAAA